MRTQVRRWGNSLALRIPRALALESGVEEGSEVEVSARAGKLVVEPTRRRYKLADLLRGVSPANLHEETWSSRPRGRETW